jgi:hypothetical protein
VRAVRGLPRRARLSRHSPDRIITIPEAVSFLEPGACSMACHLTRLTNRWQWLRR